jgi:hypothetical protein
MTIRTLVLAALTTATLLAPAASFAEGYGVGYGHDFGYRQDVRFDHAHLGWGRRPGFYRERPFDFHRHFGVGRYHGGFGHRRW